MADLTRLAEAGGRYPVPTAVRPIDLRDDLRLAPGRVPASKATGPRVRPSIGSGRESEGARRHTGERANNSLQLTRLACGKSVSDLPAELCENEWAVA